jgi:hypothetical protein
VTTRPGQSPGELIRDAVVTLSRRPFSTEPVTAEQLVDDYERQYGKRNAMRRMAEDAGELSRSSGPLPGKGTAERRRYDTFKRRLQRYRGHGGQTRKADQGWLTDLAKKIGSDRAPGTINAALRNIEAAGVGVAIGFVFWIKVSNEKTYRRRVQTFRVYLDPAGDEGTDLERFCYAARARNWDLAADHFGASYAIAYGITGNVSINWSLSFAGAAGDGGLELEW